MHEEAGILVSLTPSRSNGFRTMFDMVQNSVRRQFNDNKEEVMTALEEVEDPELDISIVNLVWSMMFVLKTKMG